MARKKQGLERLSRDAAVKVGLCAAFIVVVCFALLRSPEAEPFYTTLPDVDLTGLPPARLQPLLDRLNLQRCSCACGRSVASCRNTLLCVMDRWTAQKG